MNNTPSLPWTLISLLALILVKWVLVMVEFALVRARPSALKSGDDRGKWGAVTALVLLKRLDYSLSSVQLGSTCVSLLIGWLGISCLSSSLLEGMQLIGIDPHWEASAKEAFSIGIALLLHK